MTSPMTSPQSADEGVLKTCPFCGGESYQHKHFWEVVTCGKCASDGPAAETEAQAIAAWNTRASPPAAAGEGRVTAEVLREAHEAAKMAHEHNYWGALAWQINWRLAEVAAHLNARVQVAAVAPGVEGLLSALERLIYETTHLSVCREDGAHDCRISGETLRAARIARNSFRRTLSPTPSRDTTDGGAK